MKVNNTFTTAYIYIDGVLDNSENKKLVKFTFSAKNLFLRFADLIFEKSFQEKLEKNFYLQTPK